MIEDTYVYIYNKTTYNNSNNNTQKTIHTEEGK